MSKIGRYCKAYSVETLRKYSQWSENTTSVRKEQKIVDGNVKEVERALSDEDVLYLQESYVVTDGIYSNENIIFDQVTDKWKNYCKSVLNFEVPQIATSVEVVN
jgi:hypothetical protein